DWLKQQFKRRTRTRKSRQESSRHEATKPGTLSVKLVAKDCSQQKSSRPFWAATSTSPSTAQKIFRVKQTRTQKLLRFFLADRWMTCWFRNIRAVSLPYQRAPPWPHAV